MAFYLSLSLILSAAWLNASDIFIVSYRTEIKNSVVISESFQCAKAMTQIESAPAQSIRFHSPHQTEANTLIREHKNEIIEFLLHFGADTRADEYTKNSMTRSLITLGFAPTYITVDFNDDYATITRLIHE